jgi:hypothetical protein
MGTEKKTEKKAETKRDKVLRVSADVNGIVEEWADERECSAGEAAEHLINVGFSRLMALRSYAKKHPRAAKPAKAKKPKAAAKAKSKDGVKKAKSKDGAKAKKPKLAAPKSKPAKVKAKAKSKDVATKAKKSKAKKQRESLDMTLSAANGIAGGVAHAPGFE